MSYAAFTSAPPRLCGECKSQFTAEPRRTGRFSRRKEQKNIPDSHIGLPLPGKIIPFHINLRQWTIVLKKTPWGK
jgi:hypothetical protein